MDKIEKNVLAPHSQKCLRNVKFSTQKRLRGQKFINWKIEQTPSTNQDGASFWAKDENAHSRQKG